MRRTGDLFTEILTEFAKGASYGLGKRLMDGPKIPRIIEVNEGFFRNAHIENELYGEE